MAQVETKPADTTANFLNVPDNYFSKLPVRFGTFAGVMGSIAIMAVIGLFAIATGQDIWAAPRIIASAFLGEAAYTGILGIIVGTIIHLASGAMYGAIFAFIMPRMPRAFWSVAGLLFGLLVWVIAWIGLPFLINPVGISETTYLSALIISHATFGIFLGIAGSFYGYKNS